METDRSTRFSGRGAPPSDLRAALGHASHKQAWVDWLFARIARRYDLGNDIMSLGFHTRWKRRAVELAEIEPSSRVLDIACGTGDVTFLIAERTRGRVVGTDINPPMLAEAERKRPRGAEHIEWVEADATALPFDDGSFDRVTCTYAGRGFPEWPAILREIHRVLAPGGLFVNLDFARPPVGLVDVAYRGWLTGSGAVLGLLLHGHPQTYMYIPASMRTYRGQRWLDQEMAAVGFETTLIETTLGLMAFNLGRKPT